MKLFNNLHYLPMSHIIFSTWIPFSPWIHFDPISFCPPWKLLNDLLYLSMSHIIFPLDSFCPHIILPPPPWKSFDEFHYLP